MVTDFLLYVEVGFIVYILWFFTKWCGFELNHKFLDSLFYIKNVKNRINRIYMTLNLKFSLYLDNIIFKKLKQCNLKLNLNFG